jgi:membrane glycosyltransferase
MRRAGYEIRQLPDLEGSWEEVPGNVIDYAARDRRWAQGNLQHLRLLNYPGLRFISRVHLVTGIMSYASSPMWLALLLLSSLLSIIETAKLPQYFLPGLRSLFPRWPEIRTGETALLIGLTLAVLLLPKLLGAFLVMGSDRSRRGFGGTVRLCTSLLLEQAFSVLLAPTMMLFHAGFVLQTLLGKSVSWNAQPRGERGVTFPEAFRRQKWQLISGLLWAAVIVEFAPHFFWWLTPVFAGLVCGIPLTVWTSRSSTGRVARRWGLFLVPEETDPPAELLPLQRMHFDLKPALTLIASPSAAPARADSPRRPG